MPAVEALLVSPDPASRQLMALTVRSIERSLGVELRFRAAANGELGIRAALRDRPEIVVADEIASRAGAWSGADAWYVKPVDPFELADRLLELVHQKESA